MRDIIGEGNLGAGNVLFLNPSVGCTHLRDAFLHEQQVCIGKLMAARAFISFIFFNLGHIVHVYSLHMLYL